MNDTSASTSAASNAPVLPDAPMNLVPPNKPVTGRVTSTYLCMKGKSASFVRHVAIDVSGTPLENNFLIGQSFGVIPPGVDERGKPHKVRLYSIACPSWGEDGEGKIVSTTPKRLIDERKPESEKDDPEDHSLFLGVCSNYLCDLCVGDEVQVSGPNGKRFLLPVDPADHDFLFLATGTGIAPFRGMVMELLHGSNVCPSQVHLAMGAPYTSDLLYDDLFTETAEKFDNFHYHTAVSRERRPDGSRGIYVDALLEEKADIFGPLLENPRTLIYICGLAGMQIGVYRRLVRMGVADSYITVKDEIADKPADEWEPKEIKRYVRPTPRCMLEVY